jgi:hypothetical protein
MARLAPGATIAAMLRRPVLAVNLVGFALIMGHAPTADACSLAHNEEFQPARDGVAPAPDASPPTKPIVMARAFHHDDDSGCSTGTDTCGELHGVSLTVAATDDSGIVGVRVREVEGNRLGIEPKTWQGETLVFYAAPERLDEDVTLEVVAVDPAGNLSEPTLVTVAGRGLGGCSVGGQGGRGTLLLAFAVAAWLWRRGIQRVRLPADDPRRWTSSEPWSRARRSGSRSCSG